MKCENTTPEPCPNEAQSPFVCCYRCLWLYSEEQVRLYRLEREETDATSKAEIEGGEPCP